MVAVTKSDHTSSNLLTQDLKWTCEWPNNKGRNSMYKITHDHTEVPMHLTSENSLPHALPGDIPVGLAILREWCLERKPWDIVFPLKLALPLLQLLGREVRHHVSDLDVSMVQVQGSRVHLERRHIYHVHIILVLQNIHKQQHMVSSALA